MVAHRLKSDEEYLDIIMGLINQLKDAEAEVISLRRQRDQALALVEETKAALDRILNQ